MGVLGDDIAAATFEDREVAEEAWSMLVDADIPATILTDPGALGGLFRVQVMVSRSDLDAAQEVLAPLVNRDG